MDLTYRGIPKNYLLLSSEKENKENECGVVLGSGYQASFFENHTALRKVLFLDESGDVVNNSFSSWNEDSLILRYVTPRLISKISAHEISCPQWTFIDLKVDGKAVLCHGENSGKKIVISGMSLLPFGTHQSNFIDIITLNIFDWLFHLKKEGKEALHDESTMNTDDIVITHYSQQIQSQKLSESSPYIKWIIICALLLTSADVAYFLIKKKLFGRAV